MLSLSFLLSSIRMEWHSSEYGIQRAGERKREERLETSIVFRPFDLNIEAAVLSSTLLKTLKAYQMRWYLRLYFTFYIHNAHMTMAKTPILLFCVPL